MQHINQRGLNLIKEFEGLSLTSYKCASGIWTIGYGHTKNVTPKMKITKEIAEELLIQDLAFSESAVRQLVKVTLTDNEFSALVSFVFNVGSGNFKNSTLLRILNRGWYDQVPAQLARWNKANGEVLGGLSRRRYAEAVLWNSTI